MFNLRGFLKKYWPDVVLISFLLCLSSLFFYKLGQSSLVSWDEAWYAGIAKNILTSGDFLRLRWNGAPYFDHPPAGFWWMAISFKIFGISNFSARFASAVFGTLTLITTYFLGKELFNRWVGLTSSIALSSAPWFLSRARSGNLDIFLTFFFVLSILLAVKSVENRAFFFPLGISLALLFLTKTAVPFAIIPALIVVYWGRKVKWNDFRSAFIAFVIPVALWFIVQMVADTNFILRYLKIGFPGVGVKTSYLDNIKLAKYYIHNGIGKWFWPAIVSVFAGIFTRKRSLIILSVFCLTFVTPFLFSNKGQIWHYIPLYPFMLLSLFGFGFWLIEKMNNKNIACLTIVLIAFLVSYPQVKRSWFEFINVSAYISDEEILSKEASKYSGRLFIDGDFVPTGVFYSGKDADKVYVGRLKNIFKNENQLLLITQKWRLEQEGIKTSQYQIIKSNRDKILVRKV